MSVWRAVQTDVSIAWIERYRIAWIERYRSDRGGPA